MEFFFTFANGRHTQAEVNGAEDLTDLLGMLEDTNREYLAVSIGGTTALVRITDITTVHVV